MEFKNLGVIFINKKLTTKAGRDYFSGKTADAEDDEFDIMAFINVSKNGKTKYLSITQVSRDEEPKRAPAQAKEEATFDDEIIISEDLPF